MAVLAGRDDNIHYTPVLPVLFLLGGKHFFQDKTAFFGMRLLNATTLLTNHGILGVLFFRMPPVWKPWNFGSTVFQNAPCLETMEFWEYCFSECPLFGNHGILGVLFFRMPPVWKSWHSGSTVNGNRQNWGIMLKYHLFPRDSSEDAVLGPPKSALGPATHGPWADFGGPRTASSPESLGKRWYFGPKYSLPPLPCVSLRGHAILRYLLFHGGVCAWKTWKFSNIESQNLYLLFVWFLIWMYHRIQNKSWDKFCPNTTIDVTGPYCTGFS